jgi:hypothetical protein
MIDKLYKLYKIIKNDQGISIRWRCEGEDYIGRNKGREIKITSNETGYIFKIWNETIPLTQDDYNEFIALIKDGLF